MAQTPAWQDFQFVSAPALNAAQAQVAWSFADANLSLFHPGLVNAAAISLSHALLVVSASFGATVRCLFGTGILSGFYGTAADTTSGSYSVNMASLVPVSGSVTAYILAETYSLGEGQTTITGPTPGHPDFDPTFLPYTANLEGLDSVQLVATTTPANNNTTFEVCRMTLTSGSTAITNFSTAYQYYAVAISAPHGSWQSSVPGTYTLVVPPGVTLIQEIICTGGGGPGSFSDSSTPGTDYYSGGGGGAGGTAISHYVAVTPGQALTIVVGATGNPTVPTSGGSSYISGIIEATGGNPGGYGSSGASGAGGPPGTGTVGDILLLGGYGSDGMEGPVDFAGNGGASYWGGGGRAAAGGNQPEQNGQAPGSGGGGAYNSLSGVAYGGYGAPGFVHLRW